MRNSQISRSLLIVSINLRNGFHACEYAPLKRSRTHNAATIPHDRVRTRIRPFLLFEGRDGAGHQRIRRFSAMRRDANEEGRPLTENRADNDVATYHSAEFAADRET